jgi:L-cysteine/cystine lyase
MPTVVERQQVIRAEYPVFEQFAYMNTGTAGPIAGRTGKVIADHAERQLREGRSSMKAWMTEYPPLQQELRARMARVLGADADEIALTHHTSEGMNLSVWALNWEPGDEIVTTYQEHEGALLPIYTVARRFGVIPRFVDVGAGGAVAVERIAAALTRKTRLVVVSHVLWKNGGIMPLADLSRVVHQAGALVAVDAAQSGGAMPVDVHELGVDLFAIPGQKWLCGPEGVGALYVRRDQVSALHPTFPGYYAVRDFEAYDMSGYFIPAPGAKRFEGGTIYWPALAGMLDSLRFLQDDVGQDWSYQQAAAMTRRARELLSEVPGLTIHSPHEQGTLTAFSVEGLATQDAVLGLADRGVVIRSVRNPDHLRVSTGFYNDESDLIRLRDGLIELRKG